MKPFSRRDFIKASVLGGAAMAFPIPRILARSGIFKVHGNFPTQIGLTTGSNRADMTFRALQPFSEQVKKAIGEKLVLIKPNNVANDIQLASSHVDTLEGILEFLKSIGKTNNVIIAESAANGPTFTGYDNFGYFSLMKKFPVRLVDLDQEKSELIYVFDEKDFRPHPLRASSLILSPDTYIISAARMKTHDRVLATLSLKNVVVGAPVKDPGYSWGPDHKKGAKSDKAIVHGNGFRGVNYNLYSLAGKLHPHLAVIDGFEGMEGNGPTKGTPVDHRVCLAGTDWLAADRVGIELMGINYADVGYLNFCADAQLGEGDLSKIEVLGEKIQDHIKHYRLSDNIQKQLIWEEPVLQR